MQGLYTWYYDFFYWLFNVLKPQCLIPVSFDKPWWLLFTRQKCRLVCVIVPNFVKRSVGIWSPIIFGYIFESARIDYLAYFTLMWIVLFVVDYFADYNFVQLQLSTQSIQYYAHQLLIKIDPVFHATRSTGTIIAKIERASYAYRDVLEIGIHELLFMVVGVIAAMIPVFYVDVRLGMFTMLAIVLIVLFAVVSYVINNRAFVAHYIQAEDNVKSVGLENLSQMTLIRSTFAGNEANRRLQYRTQKSIGVERASSCSFYLMNTIMRIAYFVMVFFVAAYLIGLIESGVLSPIRAATLIITFFRGTHDVTKVGRRVYWLINCIDRIKDLFSFMQNFGKPTFPVLDEVDNRIELPLNREGNIILEAKKMKFHYNINAQIFNNHSLVLTAPYAQKNKLYGIIGPSGIGKSTLLSILGGQLHPQEGTITLNGIDIYAIDDYARRTLITMQNQTAAMLRGTVQYNLLFGLPEHTQIYTSVELQDILERVGLWQIFKQKDGLDTFIGEGGFTLSGGQRQRFNFASVYLRARYYKSLLILMDEPTSSLDEISEKHITLMIEELASKALTFVIAHRLNTLEHAAALLDISLIKATTKMRFYPPEILVKKSRYYQDLLQGSVAITD
jgi:ABC-type multidrug transport system fused ATPase/permease subunit